MKGKMCENSEKNRNNQSDMYNLNDEVVKMLKNRDEFSKKLDMVQQFEYNIR